MFGDDDDVRLGHFISLVLRHDPSAAGLALDGHGWASVDELIAGMRARGYVIDREILERIVRNNNKHRYSLSDDGLRIRANQGHSIDVDVELAPATPPDVLYHGTAQRFVASIMENGITRQSRRYVHLSRDLETAASVGKRHGQPVVLTIDAARMVEDGRQFWLSANGVWLCEAVPPQYILGSAPPVG